MKKFFAKCIVLTALILGTNPAPVNATIQWFSTGPITGPDDSALIGNATNPSIGFFVQLIYAGADGLIAPAISSGSGVTGDDQVVDARWIGAGHFSSPNGRFTAGNGYNGGLHVAGNVFYVRAWSAPATIFSNASGSTTGADTRASSIVPTAPVFYGESSLFTSVGSLDSQGLAQLQNVDAGVFQTIHFIPEPGTLGLMGLGTLGMWLMRRRLRDQA